MGTKRRGLSFFLLALLLLSSAAVGAPSPTHVRFTAAGDYAMVVEQTGAVLDALSAAGSDAHLALGDLSYAATGTEQQWCDFVTSRVGGGFPFELVAGNHEGNGMNGNINDFSACLPNQLPGAVGTYGRQYYVDVPAEDPLVRFLMISPGVLFPDGVWDYAAGTGSYNWTAAAIDGARAAGVPWVVVGMHKTCLSVGQYDCEIGADLANLLLAKKVDLVLTGHEHNYERTKQLRLGAGCPELTIGSYNPACVADTDNDLLAGAGTVFVTVGTGGIVQRDIYSDDPEAGYFAATAGANQNLTYGFSAFDATPESITASFVRGTGGSFADTFTITRDDNPPLNEPPVADFSHLTPGPLTASFDGSASSDPDGVLVAYSWDFGDGELGAGVAPQHVYSAAGTYNVTLTVTDDDGATGLVQKPVTVDPPPAGEVLAADDYERVIANGWGSADLGGAWTVSTSANGVFSVSGGLGRIVMRTAGVGPSAFLAGLSSADVDLQVQLSVDKVPEGTGGRVDQVVMLRRSSAGHYRAVVRLQANGTVQVAFVRNLTGSANVGIGTSVTVPGLTYAAGEPLLVRVQAVGSSPTDLRLKVWNAADPEPAGWTLMRQDATATLQGPGGVGLSPYLTGTTTNAPVQARYDALRVLALGDGP